MNIRLTVGVVLAFHAALVATAGTGTLRLTVRDHVGPLPAARIDIHCPNKSLPLNPIQTGIDGNLVLRGVPATSPDEPACTLVVTMVTFSEVVVTGVTVQPNQERDISIFMFETSTTRFKVASDTVIACPSLDELLTGLFKKKTLDACERLDLDPSALPVLELGKPIYDGKIVFVRRVRAPDGRAFWLLDHWENAVVPREVRFYRALYASTRVPVQLGPERDTETISFFEQGETVLVYTDPTGPLETGRVRVMTENGALGWVDADKLTDGRTETLRESP